MTSPKPPEPQFSTLITTVAGTVTLVGATLTTVGITAGVVTGLLRNDTPLTLTFLALALFGVLLGLLSVVVEGRTGGRSITWVGGVRGALSILGVLLLFVGVGLVVLRASSALKTTSRPSIAVTVTPLEKPAGYATLEATVTASGVTTRERYYIHAELLDKKQNAVDQPAFTTFVGPGTDGKLDYTFKVQFPLDPKYPWIAVTAQLDAEGKSLVTSQNCGLPVEVSPNATASDSQATVSATPAAPPIGTTCMIALAPIPSQTLSAPPTASPSKSNR